MESNSNMNTKLKLAFQLTWIKLFADCEVQGFRGDYEA